MKTTVPTFGLYGAAPMADLEDFWIHTESIAERGSVHNWEIKQHRHENFFQILQIRSGSGEAFIEGGTTRLSGGSLVFMPEKVSHGFLFSPDIDGQVITVVTQRLPSDAEQDAGLALFTSRPRIIQLDGSHADSDYLMDTLDRIESELSGGFGARDVLIAAHLEVVLTLAAAMDTFDMEEEASTARDIARIAHLNSLIGHHFREHLPVEFYARELNVSVTHLNRITKSLTGRTMNELLSDKIVSEAKRDLVFTFMTAQEIAHSLGFADPAYFTRFFSRETGDTPRQFREYERNRLSRERKPPAPILGRSSGSSRHPALN